MIFLKLAVFSLLLAAADAQKPSGEVNNSSALLLAESVQSIGSRMKRISAVFQERVYSDRATCEFVKRSTVLWTRAAHKMLDTDMYRELRAVFRHYGQNYAQFIAAIISGVGVYRPALSRTCTNFGFGMLWTNSRWFLTYIASGDRAKVVEALENMSKIREIRAIGDRIQRNVTAVNALRCSREIRDVAALADEIPFLKFDDHIFTALIRPFGVISYKRRCD